MIQNEQRLQTRIEYCTEQIALGNQRIGLILASGKATREKVRLVSESRALVLMHNGRLAVAIRKLDRIRKLRL